MRDLEFPKLSEYLSDLSKDSLQRMYGIDNKLFKVLVCPTDPEGDGIEKVANLIGLPVFKKLTRGAVVALILVSPVIFYNAKQIVAIEQRTVAGLTTPFRELPVPSEKEVPYSTQALPGPLALNSNSVVSVTIYGPSGSLSAGTANYPVGPTGPSWLI